MRALEPTSSGIAVNPNDNVRIAYEVFGDDAAARTVVFLPTWSLVHSRHWKMQVPYFALKGFRVVTFDGRGNGKSDRPAHGYSSDDYTHDTVAVFDTIGIEQAAVVGVSAGGRWGMQFASEYPERVTHLVLIGTSFKPNGSIRYDLDKFFSEPPNDDGWNKYNANFWKRDLRGFAEWFASLVCSEPHSTKAIDDAVGWALETSPDVLISTIVERPVPHLSDFASAVKCPTLIIHGTDDRLVPLQQSYDLRDAITGSKLVLMDGSGHSPDARDPIKTNHLIHEFIGHRHATNAHMAKSAEPSETRALRQQPDRSGTRAPRPGHRRRATYAHSGTRDRLASAAPGQRRAGIAWRAYPSTQLPARQRISAFRVGNDGGAPASRLLCLSQHG